MGGNQYGSTVPNEEVVDKKECTGSEVAHDEKSSTDAACIKEECKEQPCCDDVACNNVATEAKVETEAVVGEGAE